MKALDQNQYINGVHVNRIVSQPDLFSKEEAREAAIRIRNSKNVPSVSKFDFAKMWARSEGILNATIRQSDLWVSDRFNMTNDLIKYGLITVVPG